MYEPLTWDTVKQRAQAERQSVTSLEQQIARTGGDGDTYVRLARAYVREGRASEALPHYDHAELMGRDDAHEERRVVALHVNDPVEEPTKAAPREPAAAPMTPAPGSVEDPVALNNDEALS